MLRPITVAINKVNSGFALIPKSVIGLLIRLAVASVFWRSAQTKIAGWPLLGQNWKFWNITDSTLFLFEYEYSVPVLPVKVAAYMASFSEFFLSLAIIIGLLTRLSALGLLIMTAVIQFFVYPESWSVHILWAVLLIYLIKHGAGQVSVDYLIHKHYIPRNT
jgi:putative oxidoreductase